MTEPKTEPKSPLEIPDPTSMDWLMSQLPSTLTDENIESIVQHLRANRASWQIKEAAKDTKRKEPKAPKPEGPITLEGLGL